MLKGELLTVIIQDTDGSVYKGILTKEKGSSSKLTGKFHGPSSPPISKTSNKWGVKECIGRLSMGGYLDDWKSWQEVHNQLKIKGFGFKKDAVKMCMLRMARSGELDRQQIQEGKKNSYTYKKS